MKIFTSEKPRDHLLLPDRQAFDGCGNEVDHAVGNYIYKHRPEVIVDIGDHADMPSLSLYDIGKKSFEGRRYKRDIEGSIHANEIQWKPIFELQELPPAEIVQSEAVSVPRVEQVTGPEQFAVVPPFCPTHCQSMVEPQIGSWFVKL